MDLTTIQTVEEYVSLKRAVHRDLLLTYAGNCELAQYMIDDGAQNLHDATGWLIKDGRPEVALVCLRNGFGIRQETIGIAMECGYIDVLRHVKFDRLSTVMVKMDDQRIDHVEQIATLVELIHDLTMYKGFYELCHF